MSSLQPILTNMEIEFLFSLSECVPHLVSIGTQTGIHWDTAYNYKTFCLYA